jgi:hypothetical protein
MRLVKLISFGGATPLSLSSLARSSHCSKCHELMQIEEPPEAYFLFALEAGLVVEG